MTLDAQTRLNAESKHAQLKASLSQARAEFRDRFRHDAALFRTLPAASALDSVPAPAIPLSPIVARPTAEAAAAVSTPAAAASPLMGEDLVRLERLKQCCKRVRVWRRQTTNPLLPYKQQHLARATATGGGGGASSSGPSKGSTSAADHRMHLSLLMTMVVDMYEQKMTAEVGASAVLLPMSTRGGGGGVSESFPEFVVKYISARASSRRSALEQLHGLVAMLRQSSSHARLRTFASMSGVDDSYNPPEKLRAFLHMVESMHRLKMGAAAESSGGQAAKLEEASSLAEVVFYNLGVTLAVANKVLAELFEEEYYWNFRFWHSHFQELKVNYAWPACARLELEEKALSLTAVTRSSALNAAKKIDCDAFLEILLDAWTQRAKTLSEMLDAATDEDERNGAASVANKQAVQDARGHIAPLTPPELQLFDELVDEFWNAEVPWSDLTIQRRVHIACQNARAVEEIASLYRKHVAELDDAKKVWLWAHWPWDSEWEWGLLIATGDDPLCPGGSTGPRDTATLLHPVARGATDSAILPAAAESHPGRKLQPSTTVM